jgi:hypothetical protein
MNDFTQKTDNRHYKYFYSLLMALIFTLTGFSQNAGISATGATPPNAAAGLDVNFTSQGLLIPRVALTGTTNSAPLAAHVAGMLIYNTATTADVVPGFYYNDGSKWLSGLPKASASGEMQYWDGTTWVALAVGTAGQLLQINGSGVPVWGSGILASINTVQVSNIATASATTGGVVINDGGSPVTAYGVCWALTPNPTIADNITANGTGIGGFTSNITGLTTGTVYYVRAYASNSAGTAYGNQISFTTL